MAVIKSGRVGMSDSIPDYVPDRFRAGDLWRFNIPGGDCPADDGWTAKIRFVNPEHDPITITATADGADFKFSATPTAPGTGVWRWQMVATKADVGRVTIASGRVEVLADLFDAGLVTFDGKTENEKILDAVTATLSGNAKQVHQTVTVDGVSVVNRSMGELVQMRRIYSDLVRRERQAERRRQGKRSPQTRLRFFG